MFPKASKMSREPAFLFANGKEERGLRCREVAETALTGEGILLLVIAAQRLCFRRVSKDLVECRSGEVVAHHPWVEGEFKFPIHDASGPVWINIEVSRIGDGWQVDHIGRSICAAQALVTTLVLGQMARDQISIRTNFKRLAAPL